nr:ribonuclease H-like domain-containing protein [Tanacetum cinerariifolium]
MYRNIAWDKVENPNPQSTPQVPPSFEETTPPVTYLEEVEKTLGTPIEVEPLNEAKLEEVDLNCNHNTPLSSREVLSFDKLKPQPQPLPNCPPLDASLGIERGLKPPIKPQSLDSFRIKILDNLTIHTLPSSLVAFFYLRDLYFYYRPCVDNAKKHYRFKSGLLGQSGSLGVDFLNIKMRKDDWELEPIEVSFLGRRLNLPVSPKEVEKFWIKDSHQLEHIFRQVFQHMAPSHYNDVYCYYHPHLNSSVRNPLLYLLNKGRVRPVTQTKTSASWEATQFIFPAY